MAKGKTKDAALVLAELAHELRQPLTGIRTSAELLREAHPDDPAVRTRVETIVRQAERIQLLLEGEASRRGASLDLRLAPVPEVGADQVALEQIFGNLLRNALEAVAGKGG